MVLMGSAQCELPQELLEDHVGERAKDKLIWSESFTD